MPVYRVNKMVYLDKFVKCYKNIFVIPNAPNDISLNSITKTISPNQLSPFQKIFQLVVKIQDVSKSLLIK